MRGSVFSQQRCPVCHRRGDYQAQDYGAGRRVLVCQCGRSVATRLEIRLRWQGRQYRIIHDHKGERLMDLIHAERTLAKIRDQVEDGAFYPEFWVGKDSNQLLWENYLQAYLAREKARLESGDISRATYTRKKTLARFFAPLNDRNIRDLKNAHTIDFAAGLTGLAPKTKFDVLAELSHILREAELRDDIERAPQVPSVTIPRKAPKWMNQEQQARALEEIQPAHRPIFFFLMQYGCRVSEACALCWDMVDPAQGMFNLSRTFSRRRLSDNTKQRKDNPLPIVGWFANYLAGIPRGINQAPVFKNPEAHPSKNPAGFYMPDFLNDRWSEALQAAGFEHIELKNATRHSAGNQRRREGWDESLIARLLGHATTAHTRRFYVENDAEMLREKMRAEVRELKPDEKNEN